MGRNAGALDNYGYPVQRIRCADLTGDGRPEVLVASGTGYLYLLDAAGRVSWQRRLGFAVNDVGICQTEAGLRVVAGDEEGRLTAFTAAGEAVWSTATTAPVRWILPVEGGTVLAGLADGRLVQYEITR